MVQKKLKNFIIVVAFLFVLLLSGYLINRFSFSKEQPYYTVNKQMPDSVLTIGIIGDSWVAGEKLDSLVHASLLSYGINSAVISSGHPGAKSKLIYQNLFKDADNIHSSKFIIEKEPDYCIIIAGVNDAIGQVGAKFYSYHLRQIIKTLLHYNINPVVVTLPHFDIKRTTDEMNVVKKYRNYVFALFTNKGKIDNINTLEAILRSDLETENLIDSVVLIDFNEICGNPADCLGYYRNSSHLSFEGNKQLSNAIAVSLVSDINTN